MVKSYLWGGVVAHVILVIDFDLGLVLGPGGLDFGLGLDNNEILEISINHFKILL